MPNAPDPLLPLHLNILLSLAAGAIVIMAIFVVSTAIYLKGQFEVIERHVTSLKTDMDQILRDSKTLISRANSIADKVDKQMDDIQDITSQARDVAHQARNWVDRADNLLEQASPLVEVPVFFLSDKFKTIRSFFGGVLQSLKNPR
jgi:uncharacterized protein YoxC